MVQQGERKTSYKRSCFSINSFSRDVAPKSEDASGRERSKMVRIGFGVTWNGKKKNGKAAYPFADIIKTLVSTTILPLGKAQDVYKLYSRHWLYSSQPPSSFLLVSSLYWY